jgi:hypothetical protein
MVAAVVGVLVGAGAPAALAQEVTAEIRTWQGQGWKLSQPSLEVYYTVVPPSKEQQQQQDSWGGSGAAAAGAAPGGAGPSTLRMSGSLDDLSAALAKGPQPLQAHRPLDVVTLRRGAAETRVPVASIASVAFVRNPVQESTLPPYVAPTHFRYSATVVLTDGSRVEGDYVNLGAAVLQGMTPQGRVDIPWEDIEVVRFAR